MGETAHGAAGKGTQTPSVAGPFLIKQNGTDFAGPAHQQGQRQPATQRQSSATSVSDEKTLALLHLTAPSRALPSSGPSRLLSQIPASGTNTTGVLHAGHGNAALQLAALLHANGGNLVQSLTNSYREIGASNIASIPVEKSAGLLTAPSAGFQSTPAPGLFVSATLPVFGGNPHTSSSNGITEGMDRWPLEQLEQHVKMLHRLNQTVPQSIAILLSDARRKEEKRNAKRVANRRSASSSRLRKKTLVKEMTEMNAHLKRQALILALLPDLVIVVDREGIITFCSAQVERVLKHKIDDLIGVPLTDLLVPNSRGKLSNLVEQLVDFDKVANTQASPAKNGANCVKEESNVEAKAGTSISDAALGYDPVFPLSIVKVKAICDVECKNNSDSSTRNQLGNRIPSSLTNSQSLSRSPTTSSMENSGSDADAQIARSGKDAKKSDRSEKAALSSDNSNSSYVTADTKKLQKANANLVRNVRWHNKKMKDQELVEQLGTAFKDDVIGADVTANNASARLSSLQHRPEPSSSGDDSGYRESNGSRDETSSSSDSSESNGRPKPIAPTCNVCLIKNDLTTLWCEVTSSIRTAELNKESDASSREETKSRSTSKASLEAKSLYASAEVESMTSSREEVIELLLCLRPIRDGEMVDEQYRFVPRDNLRLNPFVSESSKASSGDEVYDKSSTSEEQHIYSQSRPPKKRLKLSCAKDCTDDRRNTEHVCIGEDKAVIESLMLMSSELPKKLRACERKYHG